MTTGTLKELVGAYEDLEDQIYDLKMEQKILLKKVEQEGISPKVFKQAIKVREKGREEYEETFNSVMDIVNGV